MATTMAGEAAMVTATTAGDGRGLGEASVARTEELFEALIGRLGEDAVITDPDRLVAYECDGYMIAKQRPNAVVLPKSTEEVVAVVRLCNQFQVPYVPRGAGTSLSGGTFPIGGGVMISLARMNQILEISAEDRFARVQAGVVNVHLTRALAGTKLHYAPDPSSQVSCTVGGNVATNSGGPHTLKYGVTTNHVLGLTLVMPDGTVVETGGLSEQNPGYDLTGLIVGNEGTFGIVTEAIVNLTRDPEAGRTLLATFQSIEGACEAVGEIIAAGIIPAALEMMDQMMTRVVEDALHFGFPTDAGAILIIETDGLEAGQDREAEQIAELVTQRGGAIHKRLAWTDRNNKDYKAIWRSRKSAFGAIGRLSPTYCTQDGVVPRTRLPEILRFVADTAERHQLRIANVFHAGDGNIHPILLYDEADADQVQRVLQASHEILEKCIEVGGTVTGEHGIGIEKLEFMPKMFRPEELAVMVALRDAFNPQGYCSPHKKIAPPEVADQIFARVHPGRRIPT